MKHTQLSLPLVKRFKMLCMILCIGGLAYANAAQALSFNMNGTPDIATMLINLSEAIPNLMRLVTALAYVMGFFFVIKGVIELKHFGEARSMMSQEHSLAKPLFFLFSGTMLIYFPGTVHTALSTFWSSPNPYGYLPSSSSDGDSWADLTRAVFMIIELIGVISFIKGLVTLTHLSGHSQPGTMSKAIAHIVAGALCINLYQFLQAIFVTLGIGTLSS